MFRVCITDFLAAPATLESDLLKGLATVDCLLAHHPSELLGRTDEADALIVFHETSVTSEVIARLNRCKAIVRGGVGYDNIDLEAAGARGIRVCNVPDYGVDEVADHALMLMLACSRGLVRTERSLIHSLRPWDHHAVKPVPRLVGKTMGIIGLGRIGAATALRARGLRMNVIAYDPHLRPGLDKVFGVPQVSLDTLLAQSDVVSVHTPLTPETRHIINARTLGRMKPTAILVNTARGAVVDTHALAEALATGRIAGAGIDVLPQEPPDESEPLIRLWRQRDPVVNLIVTPHTAFFSEEGCVEMRTKAAEEVARILRGEAPRNCVNPQFLNPQSLR
ncbi:MAG TPA: C-terminal binding protein [Verrucomicrobiales bacterium]|nr:C-terminal binding protein [Verrucomicrobiales bacterium]